MSDIVIKYNNDYKYSNDFSLDGYEGREERRSLEFNLKVGQRLRIDLPELRMTVYIEKYGVLISRWSDEGGLNARGK